MQATTMVRGAGTVEDQDAESGWVGLGGLSDEDRAALDAVGTRLGTTERPRGLAAAVLAWLWQ